MQWTKPLTFWVPGEPIPKGSWNTIHNPRTGRTSVIPNNKREHPWATAIADAIIWQYRRQHPGQPMPHDTRPCYVQGVFHLPRGKSVRRALPSVKPDIDKLTRSLFDSLTRSGLIEDDARIVDQHLAKCYADPVHAGVEFQIQWLADEPGRREEP